jgi:hypothetical protein
MDNSRNSKKYEKMMLFGNASSKVKKYVIFSPEFQALVFEVCPSEPKIHKMDLSIKLNENPVDFHLIEGKKAAKELGKLMCMSTVIRSKLRRGV